MQLFGKGWTLFLDRDGVINIEKENDYIHTWEEFVFYPGAAKALAALSKLYDRTIIVTNQKGIGLGATKQKDVEFIHQNLQAAIEAEGGRLDAIYFCTGLDETSPCRKPNPGMAFQAKEDFPDIDFAKSVMVGNNLSDLQFARNAGMHAVFLRTTQPDLTLPENLADLEAKDLSLLAESLLNQSRLLK